MKHEDSIFQMANQWRISVLSGYSRVYALDSYGMSLPFLSTSLISSESAVRATVSATAVAMAATGAFVSYAGMSPTSQLFGHCVVAGRNPRQIALTYDDGPNDAATPALLDLLAEHSIHASFFLIGNYARQRPDLVRAIAAGGHLIGNHTLTHPALLLSTNQRVRAELRDGNAALEDALGAAVSSQTYPYIQWFRPPFGARRPYVLRVARQLHLTPVLWNAMGYDWQRTATAEKVEARVWKGFQRNQRRGVATNVLLHDGGHASMGQDRSHTITATRNLILRWKRYFSEQNEACEFVTPEAWV